jgi:hypothetical protein
LEEVFQQTVSAISTLGNGGKDPAMVAAEKKAAHTSGDSHLHL